MTPANFQQLANFIWSVADLLRGPYHRPPQYERVMLPLTVLRRFDWVLEPTKDAVLKRYAELSAKGQPNIDALLNNLAKDEDGKPLGFHNHSQLDFRKLKGDPDNIGIGTFVWVLSNRKESHRRRKIQLIDARERWTSMKRSLGNKRRYLDEAVITFVTREHGAMDNTKTSKVFDNSDFGYRRVTVLRPLRLRFQITQEAKERFLDTCPELLDAVLAVEEAFGGEPYFDWNKVWAKVQKIVKALPEEVDGWAKGAKGTVQKKLFRDAFTGVDPEAEPVISKHQKMEALDVAALFPDQTLPAGTKPAELEGLLGLHADGKGKHIEFEPDPALKDFENIPLKQDLVSYFLREVRPYVSDAWIDRTTLDEQDGGIGKVGYEINFNREFFQYQPPRPLHEIDRELAAVEQRIMALLREVME
ncbi:MAG: type I restriction-modification system subunit M N-terminal domain-containing protein [Pseudomonadota bacterium]